MTGARPFRLGFFSYLAGERPQAEIYAEVCELFVAADELGFDVGWVAQAHFVGAHGGLPSPFVFFSTVAARTKRISLGTAVVTLPLEDPIRVAEDAAVLEALHPGRLELGLGTGFAEPRTAGAFNRDLDRRRESYDEAIAVLLRALGGEPLGPAEAVLNPPGGSLARRIWEGPSTLERVIDAADRGSGLLLSRVALGAGARPSWELQVPFVDSYLEHVTLAGREPRIGLSRTVYPARDRATAIAGLRDGVAHMAELLAEHGGPAGQSFEEAAAFMNVHYGTPEEVAESIRHEPTLPHVTDLICQLEPGRTTFEDTIAALESIATEIAPSLGWSPGFREERALHA
jgi:alkanesulfonate monooxygenase SsuD/methylene tetrahydromethanopterin reductase-like flavin-dependent oxidoreductase (luciferase family)